MITSNSPSQLQKEEEDIKEREREKKKGTSVNSDKLPKCINNNTVESYKTARKFTFK